MRDSATMIDNGMTVSERRNHNGRTFRVTKSDNGVMDSATMIDNGMRVSERRSQLVKEANGERYVEVCGGHTRQPPEHIWRDKARGRFHNINPDRARG